MFFKYLYSILQLPSILTIQGPTGLSGKHLTPNKGHSLGDINPLNAGCVNHEEAGGDKISVVDALAIEQFLVGQIDAYFE